MIRSCCRRRIGRAFDEGWLTAERLVPLYLDRIEAYDSAGRG